MGVAVLNGADPQVVELADLCDGKVIFYALSAEYDAIGAHRAAGERVVFMRDDSIVLATATEESVLLSLAALKFAAAAQPERVLAADCRRLGARYRAGSNLRRVDDLRVEAEKDELLITGTWFMEVSRIRALRGANLWSHHTSIEAIATCTPDECCIAKLPGFEGRLRDRFPHIGPLQPTGHNDVIPMAYVFEHAALGLQAQAGCPVTFSRTTQTIEPGVFQVVFEYTEEAVGRLALKLAEELCNAALQDTPFDLVAALGQLRELDEDVRLGPSTGAIVHAAVARNIPFRRLTNGSLVMFGWG